MAIGTEPKNGDYARYVEDLVNRGKPAPGQVLADPPAAQSPRGMQRPTAGKTAAGTPAGIEPVSTRASKSPTDRPHASQPLPSAAGNGATLADLARKRRSGIRIAIIAILVAWVAVHMLINVLNRPEFDAGALVPVVFLLAVAAVLFAAARSARAAARKPPGRLPPLSTVDGRRRDTP
jgi:hypothetical protein